MSEGPRRRWWVLSLRTMLALVLVIALGLGWWANSAHEQQAAIAAIHAYDGIANIDYDHGHLDPSTDLISGKPAGGVLATLEARLGRDYFHNVVSVAFGAGGPPPGVARPGEIVAAVARLRHLRQLALYLPVGDADVPHLAGMRSLARLDLGTDCPGLTDAGLGTLGGLADLEALDIDNAPITDRGLAALAGLPRLKSLALGSARPFSPTGGLFEITGEGLAHLEGLADLDSLEIHSTALNGEGLRQLGKLTHLKSLRLKGGTFGDDDLRHLAGLADLVSLEIVGTTIDGTGFRHLAGLANLGMVCIEGPNIGDPAVPHLARLPALRSVMIYGTRVTAEGLQEFRAATRLNQMGLSPAVTGDTKALKRELPSPVVVNDGTIL